MRVLLIAVAIVILPGAVSADIAAGYLWLSGQQRDNGAVSGEETTAGVYRSSAEAVLMHDMSESATGLDRETARAFVHSAVDKSTEQISRELVVASYGPGLHEELATELLNRQNPDGGFGSYIGYDSNVLDTVVSIKALSPYQGGYSQSVVRALEYIKSHQHNDGGFSISSYNDPSFALTALTAVALHEYVYSYPEVARWAVLTDQWLLTEVGASHQQMPDWELAMGLLATIPVTVDPDAYASALQALKSRQGAEGDWAHDVLATSMALRVMQLAELVQPPVSSGRGQIHGRIIDGSTGQPLPDARVILPDSEIETRTDSFGRFELAGVEAGAANIRAEATGFFGSVMSVTLEQGELLRATDIVLEPRLDIALISGRVTDAYDGNNVVMAPLVGVQGGGSVQGNMVGEYVLSAPPGLVQLSAAALGYRTAIAPAELPAASRTTWSPALVPEATGSASPGSMIVGRVVDAGFGLPITGAIISVAGNISISDFEGRFSLDVPAGLHRANLSAAGFLPKQERWLVADQGRNNLGVVKMSRDIAGLPPQLDMVGAITDAASGLPIKDALIEIGALSIGTSVDASGTYRIDDIEQNVFEVRFSAPGYVSQRKDVRYQSDGVLTLNIALEPARVGGVKSDNFGPDKASYGAYEEVMLGAALSNTSASLRRLDIGVQVLDGTGVVIATPPIESDTGSPVLGPIILGGGETYELATGWATGIAPPGDYNARLVVRDANTGQLFMEKMASFTVRPTVSLEEAAVLVSKSYSYQGASEQIDISMALSNRSNVPIEKYVSLTLRSPDGTVDEQASATISLEPAQTRPRVILNSLLFEPVQPGTFSVEAAAEELDIAPATITVAPTAHIQLRQSLAPQSITPGDGQRLRVKIELQGVEK